MHVKSQHLFHLLAGIFLVSAFFIFVTPVFGQLSPTQEREKLEQELKELEAQISTIEQDITKTQKEKDSFKNQISILRNKIKKLDLQIQQSNRIIGDLRSQIGDTSASISKTEQETAVMRNQMRSVLQEIYREDQKSTVEIVLSSEKLSDFFSNVTALELLTFRAYELFTNLEELNTYLQAQRGALESEKEEEENLVRIQMLQKQESQSVQLETEKLLEETKGKEAEYQKLLLDKKKQADQTRNRIFELIGVPDAPTFGEALEIAKAASAQTGVRPALLLAVLTQESSIGRNVGQCYLKDVKTGDGATVQGREVKKVMKPSRDIAPFLEITKELGRDFFKTPVSCPIPSVGGYGGAMGPAQFIPSTWQLYKAKIAAITGRAADPWSIKDSFLAAALYLGNAGAKAQTYDAEWRAAMIYFSGGTNQRYRFYGDSVMRIVARYEKDIAALQQ